MIKDFDMVDQAKKKLLSFDLLRISLLRCAGAENLYDKVLDMCYADIARQDDDATARLHKVCKLQTEARQQYKDARCSVLKSLKNYKSLLKYLCEYSGNEMDDD